MSSGMIIAMFGELVEAHESGLEGLGIDTIKKLREILGPDVEHVTWTGQDTLGCEIETGERALLVTLKDEQGEPCYTVVSALHLREFVDALVEAAQWLELE